MKTSLSFHPPAAGLALAVLTLLSTAASQADPQLSSWQISNSRRYARVYETAADQTSGTAVTTWPSSGQSDGGGGQSTPAYSDVQRVSTSSGYVYVYATGVASYTMGPWFLNAAKTILFPNWPSASGVLMRFPRSPAIATTKTSTGLGPIALAVNGVVLYNAEDAFSYSNEEGQDVMNGDGYWNRDALLSEGATFDAGNAHQPNNGQYHYHVNPIALRYQLGDHVTYVSSTNTYSESSSSPAHSPIIGWAFDGYPIYGPYGYSNPMSATSGVRRMVSGFVKRDGTNGTDNLATTGRTTLPQWALASQGRNSATLSAGEQGPSVSTSRPIGYYLEDNDYLGDLGKTQGVDFDLNQYNARYCVTPDFPGGTYAYFVALDSSNSPTFPYMIGPQYLGATSGGPVNSVTESVTDYADGGQDSTIAVSAINAGGTVAVTWNSVEGGTYEIDISPDNATWTKLAGAVTSAGGATTTTSTSAVAAYYRVTLMALATYSTDGTGNLSGIGNTASASAAVGTSGTAALTNISARAEEGGAAGTPISGFVLSGSGSKLMLVRAVGPTLATDFGVTGVLPDPDLSLMTGSTVLASNSAWSAADAATMSSVGAFALESGSLDAAIATTLSAGAYTAPITATSGDSGVVLLEVYDASGGAAGPALVNASARAYVGTGDGVLIAGFVVGGTGDLQLLIRAVGPTLASQNVGNVLPNPTLTLFQGSTQVAENIGWSTAADASEISSLSAEVGAFTLPAGSDDSAIVATLPPGAYSAVVGGAGASPTGTALVELYAIP